MNEERRAAQYKKFQTWFNGAPAGTWWWEENSRYFWNDQDRIMTKTESRTI